VSCPADVVLGIFSTLASDRGQHTLEHVLGSEKAPGTSSRPRIRIAGGRERHLVEERLDLCALEDHQRVRYLEVRDHHVRERVDQRLEVLAVGVERERKDSHGLRGEVAGGGDLLLLGQGLHGLCPEQIAADHGQAPADLCTRRRRGADGEVRVVCGPCGRPILQLLLGHSEVQVGRAGLVARVDGALERRAGQLVLSFLEAGHAELHLQIGVLWRRGHRLLEARDIYRLNLRNPSGAGGKAGRGGEQECRPGTAPGGGIHRGAPRGAGGNYETCQDKAEGEESSRFPVCTTLNYRRSQTAGKRFISVFARLSCPRTKVPRGARPPMAEI